jgi:hypothetical protein
MLRITDAEHYADHRLSRSLQLLKDTYLLKQHRANVVVCVRSESDLVYTLTNRPEISFPTQRLSATQDELWSVELLC